jgi:hypothetical protein
VWDKGKDTVRASHWGSEDCFGEQGNLSLRFPAGMESLSTEAIKLCNNSFG